MEDTEIANIRLAQERDEAENDIHQRVNAMHLLAEVFGCSTDEVEIILSILRSHDVYKITEAVEDFTADTPLKWSFGAIVIAAKTVVWQELYGRVDDTLHRKLKGVAVSTHPLIYGTSIGDGNGLDEGTLMAYTDMIKYGVNLDRVNALAKAYREQEA